MTAAFTLLCDPFSSIANGGGLSRKAMQAHLILTAILFGEVQLSDTQCLTSGNLADLLTSDYVTREMLEQGIVKIAIRDCNSAGSTLSSVQELVGTFGSNRLNPTYADMFSKCAQLIDGHKSTTPWSFSGVSSYYTSKTFDLIDRESIKRGWADDIKYIELMRFLFRKADETDGLLKRDYIRLGAVEHFRHMGMEVDHEFNEFLKDVSSAYYFSAVPSFLGIATVHDAGHAGIIKLRDGIDLRPNNGGEWEDKPSPLDLRFYIEAMSILDVDDVLKLIESREAREYRSSLFRHLAQPSAASLSDLRASLFELHDKIDHTLLDKDRRFKGDTSVNSIRRARTFIDTASTSAGFLLSVGTALLGQSLPGLSTVIGISAKKLKDEKFSEGRLFRHSAARAFAAKQAYDDRLRALGKDATISVSVEADDGEARFDLKLPSFMAP